MTDALRALIAGPNADERRQGLISLIPPDTVILSATVRGDTAYISFSEDFRYNAHGTDGYLGQLREVVFTATEFSNVNNVQILIEGQRVNFLGEGIWIGSPISRDML
jgi:spore germination protein GerM